LAQHVSPDLEHQPMETALPVSLPVEERAAPAPAPPVESAALGWLPTRRWLIHPDGGAAWSIEERMFADGSSLFFVNDAGFVRVRRYPPNWLDLPDEALAALLGQPRA
jgi:hypothetical protein